jgi:hypothetical protein
MKLFYLLCGLALCMAFNRAISDDPITAPREVQAIPAPNTPDGFTIANGRVYFIRHGQMVPLREEVILRVSPNGTITAFDGTTYRIPHGQVLTLSAGVAALSPAGQPAANGGAEAATAPQPNGAPQTPGPNLDTSPFSRFHPVSEPKAVNPQLTYPVPNTSPFTRFHQPAVPQEPAPAPAAPEVPNNAPTGPYR